ncbi:putative isopenicillin N synthase [Dioscorea sansibarensis]
MAAALRRRGSWISRAPPPTPILAGKGQRSAAFDDLVLSEYLETNLKVPDLNLPDCYFPARSPPPIPAEIQFDSLVSDDNTAVQRVMEAAVAVGAFRIEGGVTKEEVRAAIEAWRTVLGFWEEKNEALREFISNRGDGIQAFYWARPMSSVMEKAWSESDQPFRETVEKFASKLDLVAECIAKILADNVKNQRHTESISKKGSVLCLRMHDLNHSEKDQRDIEELHHSYALSLHLSSDDHKLYFHSPKGSSSFVLPAGSVLITIREELEEWCNGELKSANVEPLHDDVSSFSLEFMCSPLVLDKAYGPVTEKNISVMDQLLLLLVLAFLYKLWTLFST